MTTSVLSAIERDTIVRRGYWLSLITLIWNSLEGVIAIVLGNQRGKRAVAPRGLIGQPTRDWTGCRLTHGHAVSRACETSCWDGIGQSGTHRGIGTDIALFVSVGDSSRRPALERDARLVVGRPGCSAHDGPHHCARRPWGPSWSTLMRGGLLFVTGRSAVRCSRECVRNSDEPEPSRWITCA